MEVLGEIICLILGGILVLKGIWDVFLVHIFFWPPGDMGNPFLSIAMIIVGIVILNLPSMMAE